MTVLAQVSVSLDGFVAGPEQSADAPIGVGGMRLHQWALATRAWNAQHGGAGGAEGPDSDVVARLTDGIGAYVMGRNMFSPGRGAWDPEWRGWWGEDPPYHTPVFVLTHHPREPLTMEGGNSFHFVTDGIGAALDAAATAAGSKHVMVAGGASVIQQAIAAGRLDELYLHIVPIVLGAGERLLENVGDPRLEPVEVVASPAVTHIRYRVG